MAIMQGAHAALVGRIGGERRIEEVEGGSSDRKRAAFLRRAGAGCPRKNERQYEPH